jgi:pyruvate formate lyase activating enzyme
VPWHLSAYHPSYRWNAPPTDPAVLLRLAKRARKILPFVYAGNVLEEENKTLCPHCNAALIKRWGYRITTRGLTPPQGGPATGRLQAYRCAACGQEVPVWR